ncbi:hypothetical protein NIES4074_50200 [Cylindrospermum sp. NIES-4074]|nr:hypothetical protein NIES4074_50200 [Cylindrospermum sp. NIES-4074]
MAVLVTKRVKVNGFTKQYGHGLLRHEKFVLVSARAKFKGSSNLRDAEKACPEKVQFQGQQLRKENQ